MTSIPDIVDLAGDDEKVNPVLLGNEIQIKGHARIQAVLRELVTRGHTLTHDEEVLYLFPGYW